MGDSLSTLFQVLRMANIFNPDGIHRNDTGNADLDHGIGGQNQNHQIPNWNDETDLDAESARVSGIGGTVNRERTAPPTARPTPNQNGQTVPPYQNPEPPVTGSVPTEKVAGGGVYENPEPPVSEGLPGQDGPQGDSQIRQELLKMMTQKSQSTEALRQLILNPPVRSKPGKWRTIAALVAGMGTGSPALGERTLYSDYYRDMEDYKDRLEPLARLAQIERGDATNDRMIALGLMRDENMDIRERHRQEYDAGRIKIQQQRAAAYEYKSKHPNHVIKIARDGSMVGIDPLTNQAAPILDGFGQRVYGKDLSYEDQQALLQDNALERIEATGEQARLTEETRQTGRTDLKETDIEADKEAARVKAKAAGGGEDGELNELNKRRLIERNYRKIISDNPEFAAGFEKDLTGSIVIKDGFFSPEDRKEIARRLLTDVNKSISPIAPVPSHGSTTPSAKTARTPTPRQPEGTIKVTSPDGKKGTIPLKQWPAAEKQGYKKRYD